MCHPKRDPSFTPSSTGSTTTAWSWPSFVWSPLMESVAKAVNWPTSIPASWPANQKAS